MSSFTPVGLEDESVEKPIIDSRKTITGKLMSLCLTKYIMYTLEKVDHIIYFNANMLVIFSIKTGLKFSMYFLLVFL